MSLAFNVEQYVDVLFNGRGKRAMNVVPSEFPESDGLPHSPYARFDLELAKLKIADARKELGLRPDEPIHLTLDLSGRDEYDRRVGEFARYQFARIGVEIKVELNDWPTLQEKVEKKQCQLYAMGWHADYPDPENFLQLFYGPNIPKGMNNSNYSNRAFDALYDKVAVMLPSKERTALYAQMVEMLNEDCPVILLTEPVSMTLAQPWLHNVKPHPIGYGMLRYQRIDAEAQRHARQD
jgi:ABC-type transport system substrate-binding protein